MDKDFTIEAQGWSDYRFEDKDFTGIEPMGNLKYAKEILEMMRLYPFILSFIDMV